MYALRHWHPWFVRFYLILSNHYWTMCIAPSYTDDHRYHRHIHIYYYLPTLNFSMCNSHLGSNGYSHHIPFPSFVYLSNLHYTNRMIYRVSVNPPHCRRIRFSGFQSTPLPNRYRSPPTKADRTQYTCKCLL